MINEKNKFLTVSWLSGLLSAKIFISTGEWGVQMPQLTAENSHLLRSGSQGAALVMWKYNGWAPDKHGQVASYYLKQLVYWRIYASLNVNELMKGTSILYRLRTKVSWTWWRPTKLFDKLL